jgi:hypothetical protein
MPLSPDLVGKKFGHWIVLERTSEVQCGKVLWHCLCDCGEMRKVATSNLTRGLSKSCGCASREAARKRLTVHGRTGSPEFRSWQLMLDRCYNPRNKRFTDYGGRGIAVCGRWRNSFSNFFADMGPRPLWFSIEREDVNGNYEPSNCSWIPLGQQCRNRRSSRFLSAKGEKKIMSDWARDLHMSPSLLHYHLAHKTMEQVLEERLG